LIQFFDFIKKPYFEEIAVKSVIAVATTIATAAVIVTAIAVAFEVPSELSYGFVHQSFCRHVLSGFEGV
jgi:hypothetical protein